MSKAKSTSRLKSMIKNTNRHFFRKVGRIFKYGEIGFSRNIWLSITATIVTTLTLILLFATIVAGVVLTNTADSIRKKIDISIYFEPDTSKLALTSMKNKMEQLDNVVEAKISTSEEEFAKMKQEAIDKDDQSTLTAIETVGEKLFIKKQPAAMSISVYNPDDLSTIKTLVATDEEFKDNLSTNSKYAPTYDTKSTTIQTISSWANIATTGGTALCILFLVISILVIFNTIRMAIYSRSEEIYMEKLVGADNSFIRGPFLIEAMMSGIFAGIIASILSFIGYWTLSPKLAGYDISVANVDAFIGETRGTVLVIIALVLTGAIITLISSRLAVHKYLKRF